MGKDNGFDKLGFTGKFRIYQQRVLDNTEKFLENNKIHIVAAPGSGKTVLGIELINKIGKPALILSPSIAIREQWIERVQELFLKNKEDLNEICSNDLKNPKTLTSITYQSLYSAFNHLKAKKRIKDEDNDEIIENEDFSGFDLLKTIKENKIETICLDEAHHLKAEWQKALYSFIKIIEKDVKIIALTATPPYDSDAYEWKKYIDICGEIDEEIFVPELVRAKTLCPHQDFVYFNYPTKDELKKVNHYYEKVEALISRVFSEKKLLEIILNSDFYNHPSSHSEPLLDSPLLLKSIVFFLKANNIKIKKSFSNLLTRSDRIGIFSVSQAEIMFQAIIDDTELFAAEQKEYLKELLKLYGVIEKNKVCLKSNPKIEKTVFSSLSKLESIKTITETEFKNKGNNLRMLILTDYIKKDGDILGGTGEITELGVVPVFETLRRNFSDLSIAALSGKIIIVPNKALESIFVHCKNANIRISAKKISGTDHSELSFAGINGFQKISVITKAFNEGYINVIVGTKSLLGEGWDSPVINTLILASYVGSFVQSNQMRGRAIRINKHNPSKVSNIWHLCTVFPSKSDNSLNPFAKEEINSADYDMLIRRFSTFIGLNYESDIIENGIERISIIQPPFNNQRIIRINEKMIAAASDRENTASKWFVSLEKATDEVAIQKEQTSPVMHKKYAFTNGMYMMLLSILTYAFMQLIMRLFVYEKTVGMIIASVSGVFATYIFFFIMRKFLFFLSPNRIIVRISKGVLSALQETAVISKSARIDTLHDKKAFRTTVGIKNCSNYEKNVFFKAIADLLSPIENPRYLIVKMSFFMDCKTSFAVPDILGNKKENADILRNSLNHIGYFKLIYTRSPEGRKILKKCRRKAFISKNFRQTHGRKRLVSKWV